MIDVDPTAMYRRPHSCQYEGGCSKTPSYNLPNMGKAPIFCAAHKQAGMVNIVNRTCEEEECPRQPFYNFPGEPKARMCNSHKLQGMVDVRHATCQHQDCYKRAIYNEEGERKGKFCSLHRTDSMVNVVKKTCEEPGCRKQPKVR